MLWCLVAYGFLSEAALNFAHLQIIGGLVVGPGFAQCLAVVVAVVGFLGAAAVVAAADADVALLAGIAQVVQDAEPVAGG